MTTRKLRRQITYEAARLMYFREEAEYYRAKQKAFKRLSKDWIKPSDLPTNAEIHDEIQSLVRNYEGSQRVDELLQMRLLEGYAPRLIGSVLTGHVRKRKQVRKNDQNQIYTHVHIDPYQLFYSLLLPLENVKQHPKYHPEGGVQYHSLQVFDLACDELPYDEEFLQAALLHDIGKGIDVSNHVAAGLEALDGFISPRTAWLIEHHRRTSSPIEDWAM
jgi:HD domain